MNTKQIPLNGLGPGATKGARALATERAINAYARARLNPLAEVALATADALRGHDDPVLRALGRELRVAAFA